ncbi:general substrate transporter [Penicillium desertorum]|uniref:General substrate transporter n=1 Tax=Penicillium desertorum TaxID=1303715 RepID=A0A9W9WJ67_9EURO|nr:general substrate transporter [Penicillium desertorum]KAJ5483179.1 general substrate transporter [Penicillium desertorum]
MRTGNKYNFLIVFFVALGSFTYGFNSAIIGSILGLPSFLNYFDLSTTGANAEDGNRLIGATNGLFAGGGIIGCLVVPSLLSSLGRRLTIQITAIVCVVSAALQTGSVHIAMLLIGRFINGVGVGMMDVSVPIYQSEISPAKVRGRMVGSHGFLVVCGYALAGWAGYGCFFITEAGLQWRLCLAFQIIAPLALLIGSPWIPESPRWLCTKSRNDEALKTLCKLHDIRDNDETTLAQHEYQLISAQVHADGQDLDGFGWKAAFAKKSFRKRLLIGFFVQCIAQSTGVLVVNNYQILLYNGLGLKDSLPLNLYACYNTWAAFMNFVNSLMLDRWGRVRIMIIGMIGCSLALSGFTAMVAEFGGTMNKVGNGFGVFFLYLFVTFYGGSLDASSYVYCAEIFPTSIRAQGVGFSVSGLFVMTLIYTQAAPVAFSNIGWRYYLVFIIVPWVGVFLMKKYCPETAGLELEEIHMLFDGSAGEDLHVAANGPSEDGNVVCTKSSKERSDCHSEHYERV